ncbi:hypothetical protein F7734_35485 [Scytonema sp. UIC 10036]|uniref:AAA-like domain-containing protein n=1 Tax=Scytonema sp. UIC 10036 TaxID=2304196 RepID=UPI0012DA34A5|nr:AAA-like domain-containing protein [Scytonema sp. UIC 10036]MUG97348.1 hypothetical protein [Scytonema sp. UIC 10036]
MLDEYQFSGSLPEEATTYVTREADRELYQGLTAGKFCYVLNSRQSGKSSLRVRIMRRLRDNGVECAAIDLSAGGIQKVPPEQWYADLIDTLIDSFGLDLEFGDWWSENQLNSLVTRFRLFLEEILLVEIQKNIVIFIDEIDSVLSLNFPTDDFFAFIRSCYNQRVANPIYNRLTFCLLGVASPSNLIEDKKRTPFNIGKAITLKGFQLHEVDSLEKGLYGKYSNPHAVMKDILHWTGGQPFLTQKLCQFMVEESLQDNPRTVKQVVRSRILENWESQDEPEHFRTIRDRILRDEQRAGYLLELYQQIRVAEEKAEITADDTLEHSELQLSGLVVRQQNQLRVYNPIYREIFDKIWIETQLRNLRPYSDNFRFWRTSDGKDESRLLRGKALQDALEWAFDKSLNYQDREFLAASQAKEKQEEIAALEKEAALERERKDREEEIAALEKEAALERERKDREAIEKRNQVLTKGYTKAQQLISIGKVVLIVAVLGAAISVIVARNQVQTAKDAEQRLKEANSKAGIAKDELEQARQEVSAARLEARRTEKNARVIQKYAKDAEGKLSSIRKSQQQAEALRKAAESEKAKAKHDALLALKTASDAKGELLVVRKNQQKAEEALKIAQQSEALANNKAQKAHREAETAQQRLTRIDNQAKNVSLLSELSGELHSKNMQEEADEAKRQLGLSYAIKENSKLQQALLLSGIAFAYQKLARSDEAITAIQDSLNLLEDKYVKNSPQEKEVRVYVLNLQGTLLKEQGDYQKAVKVYKEAFALLQFKTTKLYSFNQEIQVINQKNVEFLHWELIDLLQKIPDSHLLSQVRKSLIKHYYAEIEDSMKKENWREADVKTHRLMLVIASREKEGYLDSEQLNSFSCQHLQTIDSLWVRYSEGIYGFSVQKNIFTKLLNKDINKLKNLEFLDYVKFANSVKWSEEKKLNSEWNKDYFNLKSYDQFNFRGRTILDNSLKLDREEIRKIPGHLPTPPLFLHSPLLLKYPKGFPSVISPTYLSFLDYENSIKPIARLSIDCNEKPGN